MSAKQLKDEDLIPPERMTLESGISVEVDPGIHAAMTEAWAEGLGAHGAGEPRKTNPYDRCQSRVRHTWWDRGWLCSSRMKRRRT
jgi:hypothetical protein